MVQTNLPQTIKAKSASSFEWFYRCEVRTNKEFGESGLQEWQQQRRQRDLSGGQLGKNRKNNQKVKILSNWHCLAADFLDFQTISRIETLGTS